MLNSSCVPKIMLKKKLTQPEIWVNFMKCQFPIIGSGVAKGGAWEVAHTPTCPWVHKIGLQSATVMCLKVSWIVKLK